MSEAVDCTSCSSWPIFFYVACNLSSKFGRSVEGGFHFSVNESFIIPYVLLVFFFPLMKSEYSKSSERTSVNCGVLTSKPIYETSIKMILISNFKKPVPPFKSIHFLYRTVHFKWADVLSISLIV